MGKTAERWRGAINAEGGRKQDSNMRKARRPKGMTKRKCSTWNIRQGKGSRETPCSGIKNRHGEVRLSDDAHERSCSLCN